MQSNVQTAPSILVKVFYPADNTEKLIGFATGLTYSVTQGQKPLFVVDSPFPAEIEQAAAPSMVRGSMVLYMPKGSTPESAGLVPYRTDAKGQIHMASSKFMSIRLYDRLTSALILAVEYCKVGQYTVAIRSRNIVTVQMEFEGQFLTPGNAGR